MHRFPLHGLLLMLGGVVLAGASAWARTPSMGGTSYFAPAAPPRMRDYSWTYLDPPDIREIKVHDIVTIIIDEKAEVIQNSRFQRNRQGTFTADLEKFIRFKDGKLATAADEQPGIEGRLQNRLQSQGRATDQEGMRYRIAATVVDVLPNGVLVIEARKSIRANRDLWEYSLTGKVRSQDVNRDNTALSENIADLDIIKKKRGRAWSSTKRGWGTVLLDVLWPF